MTIGDIEPLLESAGELLKEYWVAAELDDPALEDHADEIREACERVQAVDPDNVTAAVGLCVLASATLRHHIEYISPVRAVLDEATTPFDSLEDVGDEEGRGLAHEAVHAARRALALDAANNLAAYELGYALEWLGRHGEAADAYRLAVELDPFEEAAPRRLEALTGIAAPGPEHGLDIGHSRGFYELEMTHVVYHNGDTEGWTWLLADPDSVRASADGYVDEWASRDELIGREFSLRTHFPGRQDTVVELREAIRRGPDGTWDVDWSAVTIPAPLEALLPTGQPIRLNGAVLFFGGNEHACDE